MQKTDKPFAKWLPPQDHRDEVAAFFKDLVAAIRKSGLQMFSSTAWMKDVEHFNNDFGTALEPYPLAAYACLSTIGSKYPRQAVTAIFDRANNVGLKLAQAASYAESDKHVYPGISDSISTMPLPKPLTARDVPAMQAADLIAWEIRKAHFKMKEWQMLPGRPQGDRQAQWQHFLDYTKETTGEDPKLRKSLDALITNGAVNSVVWDYDQLKTTHEARRGIWTLADEGQLS